MSPRIPHSRIRHARKASHERSIAVVGGLGQIGKQFVHQTHKAGWQGGVLMVKRAYPQVRALKRGLEILDALSQLGPSTPALLSARTGVDRTTVYRLLATLEESGFVDGREDGTFLLGDQLARLASGVTSDDRLAKLASALLARFTVKSGWPGDYAVWSGSGMRIAASSHHLTSMTFYRRLLGQNRPLLTTALGQAFLTACEPAMRAAVLAQSSAMDGWNIDAEQPRIVAFIDATQRRGYAACVSSYDAKIAAIAVPVFNGEGPIGAVNTVFFRAAMTTQTAATLYLDALRGIADELNCQRVAIV
jgi:IclR family mhp operon transcriptional activator